MTASLIQKLAAYECEVAQLKCEIERLNEGELAHALAEHRRENARLKEQVERYRALIVALTSQPESIQQEPSVLPSTIGMLPYRPPYSLEAKPIDPLIQDRETFREAYKDDLSKLR